MTTFHLLLVLFTALRRTSGLSVRSSTGMTLHTSSINRPSYGYAASCSPLFTRSTVSADRPDLSLGISSATDMDRSGAPDKTAPFPIVLWRFTRPHTLIGSALAIPALHVLAAPSYGAVFSVQTLLSLVFAMVPSLLMNLYITGLNQVTDVEIDKINKPNLPIPAGDLSRKDASVIVLTALALSLFIGLSNPLLGTAGLNTALWGSALLGTMYSLPPFRLKRFPLLAALCIVCVRGTIINAGFFAHAKAAAYGSHQSSVLHYLFTDRACMLSSLFFGIFGIVIALMKDVPDVKGDKVSNIRTFSVRVGETRIFNTMKTLLVGLFYSFGAGFLYKVPSASSWPIALCRCIVGLSCLAAGQSVKKEAVAVDRKDSKAVYGFYMFLWRLFFASYIILPLAR